MQPEQVLNAIIEQLESDLDTHIKAANDAADAATHSESVAETKWDTFGLESSYLAKGQQKRVAEISETLSYFRALKSLESSECQIIELNCVISLEGDNQSLFFLLAGTGGGVKVNINGQSLTVITPQSPIGQKLLEKYEGDCVDIPVKAIVSEFEVLSITKIG